MNYIGSKLSLLPFLESSIESIIPNDLKQEAIFCDLFAGTGVVGSYFKKKNYTVYANDIQYYSYVLIKHYIENNEIPSFEKLLPHLPNTSDNEDALSTVLSYLNQLEGKKGFIYNHYCLGGTKGQTYERQYFTDENGMRCDAIRQQIEDWKNEGYITPNAYYYLLTILLEAIDKVANTASVYEAFLKKYKRTALKPLTLQPLDIITNERKNVVFNKDINVLIKEIKGDILYLDPPYNRRQYASNYHILETIARYDHPIIRGKTGIRENSHQKSLFCSKVKAQEAFRHLIKHANFKYIFLSYNDEGIIPLSSIEEILKEKGTYGRFQQPYRRYKADNNRVYQKNETVEYLHYVITHS